jgi:glycerol-3-phosphate dehydrogenase
MTQGYDVIVIGGGVIGSAIARELSRYELKIAVLEKELDVCTETSGRNSAVLHAGFNNKTGSLMAKFCVEGNRGFEKTAHELSVPFKRTGKVVVGFDEQDLFSLKSLKEQGDRNGCPNLEIIDRQQLKVLAPFIEGEFALFSPMTGILNTFIYTIALAENAHKNGVDYFLGREVTGIVSNNPSDPTKFTIQTICSSVGTSLRPDPQQHEYFHARWVINSAGLQSDAVARMLGNTNYTIYPCRGEYFILDRKLSPYLSMPAYPVPNVKTGGLGVHLTPTVDGTILIGPSAEYIDDKDDYASTQPVMDLLLKDGARIFPKLSAASVIRSYTGIRPKLVSRTKGGYADFVIEESSSHPQAINLIGIESPGLTSSLPIARYVVEMIAGKEDLAINSDFDPNQSGILCFKDQTDDSKRRLIEANPDYGEIICRCETVTRAEILAAIHNPLGVETLSGIKIRTRAMMGRCQGGYCQTRIAELLMQEKHLKPQELRLLRNGSHMFEGSVRDI